MDTKKIWRRFAIIAISAWTINGCTNTPAVPDSSFAEYISGYTGGVLSGDDHIIIELESPVNDLQGTETEINKALTKLFRFSPSIEGSAQCANSRRIEFIPEKGSLKAGKTYTCRFLLGNIVETDKSHKEFEFSFRTAPKEARLESGGIRISATDRVNAVVTGKLTLSEGIDIDNPASLIDFKWSGEGGTFDVQETDRNTLTFTATGLKRGQAEEGLDISFKPGNTGFAKCEDLHIRIPAEGVFTVTDSRQNLADNRIDVIFSEPLHKGISTKGLVTVDGTDDNVRTAISDNVLSIWYGNQEREALTLEISQYLRDIDGKSLGDNWIQTFRTGIPKPEVRFAEEGNILPDMENPIIPFVAENLKAVDISIIKIYPNNILSFLQENDMQGGSGIRRAGRMIYKTTMRLDNDPAKDLSKPNIFTVGVKGLFKKDPCAIYRMRLSFKQEYYLRNGSIDKTGELIRTGEGGLTEEENAVWDEPNPYYYDGNYDWSKYRWQDRDNPLTPSYYMDYSFPARNFMTSALALTAKYGDGSSLWAGVSDINSAEPVSGAEITVYNYQLQKIGEAKSQSDGMTEVKLKGKPFIVNAKKAGSEAYLKVNDGNEKSLSRFDTGGETLQKGLKAYVYGERGVWRPGDTLHLTMILHSDEKIPDSHPASIDVYTPQGQFFMRKTCYKATNGFYSFEIPTAPDSPTGLWNAYVKVGGAAFHKALRIESIMPNRLKVNVNFSQNTLRGGSQANVNVSSTWLTGMAASGLQSKVELTLKPGKPSFKGYEGYIFRDPASSFETFSTTLFEKRLDGNGKTSATVTLPKVPQAPGMLSANVLGTVMENGGDESYTALTLPYSPFSAYVGVQLPEGEGFMETGKTHDIPVALVDSEGRTVAGHRLEWRIFKLKWSWWWESRKEPLDSYINASAASAESSGTFVSGKGKMSISFNVNDEDWGRYLIYVKDLDSGHASGGIVYADMPSYRGRADRNDPSAPAMLSFSTDKKSYKAGETATVYIPAAEGGRALVSIEKGGRVMKSEWVRVNGETPYKIKISGDMAPNFYVHITLVQPYANSANDLPLRMYGVQPIMVENPDSHLEPVISMPDKLHPEETFTITVSEKSRKKMTYTLAIVDEGLLDLTAFRTPDPWNFMFRREALSVRTWDGYDEIFGSSGGALSAMLSIGGDEGLVKGARKENRFNPVVKFLGPFTLNSGSQTHKIKLPMYVGSVRVMVVAGSDNSYGNASKTVPVTSPVMILPTLPRFAGCGENFTLPVNVFVMEEGIGKVNVSVRCEGALTIDGAASETLTFEKKGDKMARFALKSSDKGGMAKVTVFAESGGHKMTETLNIEILNRAPRITSAESVLLSRNESRTFRFHPFKTEDGNCAWLEASTYPSIGWNSLFSYMKNYQYTCTEQLSAKGLTILYSMPMLSEANAAEAKKMLPEILTSLYSRQLSNGGFSYWPGDTHTDEWVTSMAGELLVQAKAEGFDVNSGVIKNWLNYQKQCVRNYRTAKVYELSDLTQAYRLYTMALARNADEAAMNRMKESGNLSWQATMMLGSAYALCGKKSTATAMAEAQTGEEVGMTSPRTYGTGLRDKAIALETFVRSGNLQGAFAYAVMMGQNENEGLKPWSMSTQESMFMSKAMSLLSKDADAGAVSIEVNDGVTGARSISGEKQVKADLETTAGTVEVKNNASGPVYLQFITVSQNAPGAVVNAKSSGIKLDVRYLGADGSTISPASIRQGTSFTASIKVTNLNQMDDVWNLALTEMIPSGWEIMNERMTGQDVPSSGKYDYLDIRDDRNIFYFSLPRGESKEFRIKLRAAYEGKFILPSVTCEAMYNPSVSACTASGYAEVTR